MSNGHVFFLSSSQSLTEYHAIHPNSSLKPGKNVVTRLLTTINKLYEGFQGKEQISPNHSKGVKFIRATEKQTK